MEFGTFSFTIWGGIKKFLDPQNTHTLTIFRGGINKFLDPPKFIYLQTKHKKWIFSATVHLTRKRFVFPGRYLKADHFGKNWTWLVGCSKMLKGGGLKNYEC